MSLPSSLLKFQYLQGENGRGSLHWHRAHLDGAPFRGSNPFLTEEEYEQRTMRVGDPHNATFDLDKPEDNQRYLQVMDMIVNQWAKLIFIERMITPDRKEVYIEWVQWYIEPSGASELGAPPGMD